MKCRNCGSTNVSDGAQQDVMIPHRDIRNTCDHYTSTWRCNHCGKVWPKVDTTGVD